MSTVQLITADLASVYSEGYIWQRRSPASGHPIKSVQLLKQTKQHGVSFPVPQEMGFSVASLSSRASSKQKKKSKNQKKKSVISLKLIFIFHRVVCCSCVRGRTAWSIQIFISTPKSPRCFPSFPLGCKPTHLLTVSLCKGLAGKRRGRRADRSCPKVHLSNLFRSRLGRATGGKMKEKSLIETAKMQGNVLVRRLFDSYVVYDADFVPFPSSVSSRFP